MRNMILGLCLVGALVYAQSASAIYMLQPVGICVTTQVTDSSGYTWTSTQCWIEWEATWVGGPSGPGTFDPFPRRGGVPIPTSPYDVDSDGLMDCWKDLTADGDYTPSENQDWGPRTIDGEPDFHDGLDIGAVRGTSVHAIAGGVVFEVKYTNLNGNYVRINHSDGSQGVYIHLLDYSVSAGDSIFPGQNIGRSNCTGTECKGDHLHVTVWPTTTDRTEGTSLNPIDYAGGEACQK